MIEENWIIPHVPTTGNGFIDVGANLCTWTKWLAPGYKFVHAIEPFQEAIDAAGVLPSNVTMHPVGAWSKETRIHFGTYAPGKLLFAQEDIESYFSEIGTNAPSDEKSLVLPCQTLDSLVPEKDEITFLKIDVEGAELQVMLGAQEIIKRSRPFMIIEIHSRKNAPTIEMILCLEDYSIDIVRNPWYDESRQLAHWSNHYWMLCYP